MNFKAWLHGIDSVEWRKCLLAAVLYVFEIALTGSHKPPQKAHAGNHRDDVHMKSK